MKCEETTAEDQLNFNLNKNGFLGGIKFKVEALNRNEEWKDQIRIKINDDFNKILS